MLILKLLKPIGNLASYIQYKRDRLHLENLIRNGLKIGRNVYIGLNVLIDSGYPYLIEIGDNCRITAGAFILAHDATTFKDSGVTRIAPVKILEGSFIGYGAIILPGVTVGPRAMIAAGSVVNRDIGADKLAAGNPARPYGNYSDLLEKYRALAASCTAFNEEDVRKGVITPDEIITALRENPFAFVHGIPNKDPFYVNTDTDELRAKALKKSIELKSSQVHSELTSLTPEAKDESSQE